MSHYCLFFFYVWTLPGYAAEQCIGGAPSKTIWWCNFAPEIGVIREQLLAWPPPYYMQTQDVKQRDCSLNLYRIEKIATISLSGCPRAQPGLSLGRGVWWLYPFRSNIDELKKYGKSKKYSVQTFEGGFEHQHPS